MINRNVVTNLQVVLRISETRLVQSPK